MRAAAGRNGARAAALVLALFLCVGGLLLWPGETGRAAAPGPGGTNGVGAPQGGQGGSPEGGPRGEGPPREGPAGPGERPNDGALTWSAYRIGDSPIGADGTFAWTKPDAKDGWLRMPILGEQEGAVEQPYRWFRAFAAVDRFQDPYLLFLGNGYEFELYSGSDLLYRSGDMKPETVEVTNGLPRWIPLAAHDADKPLFLRVYSETETVQRGMLGRIAIGNQSELRVGMLRGELPQYGGLLAFFFIGFVSLLLYFIDRGRRGNLYFALFALAVGAYIAIDLKSPHLFGAFPNVAPYLRDPILAFLGYAFALYFTETFATKFNRALRLAGRLLIGASATLSLAKLLRPAPFVHYDHLWSAARDLGVAAYCLLALALLAFALRRQRGPDELAFAAGFAPFLLVNAVGQPVRYFLNANPTGFAIRPHEFHGLLTATSNAALLFSALFLAVISVRRYAAVYRKSRELNRSLAESNAELRRMDEMKDHFLANTSHELRTPLHGIIGLSESLADGAAGELPEAAAAHLRMIASGGKRLASLVDDILDFSKLRHDEIRLATKPLRMRDLTEIVIRTIGPLARGKPYRIANDVSEECWVLADEDRVQQILYNLIGNAVKFTEKGSVVVSSVRQGADRWTIRVRDTGIGIAEDRLAAVFESFVQADGSTAREYGGTGLGLTISKKLVELHDGTLDAESRLGEGSVFSFALPSAEPTDEAAPDAAQGTSFDRAEPAGALLLPALQLPPDGAPDLGSAESAADAEAISFYEEPAVILAVDDEGMNLQVLRNYLTLSNYTVIEASGGAQALELLEGGLRPDMLLLDVMMPRMSGFELCRIVRERYGNRGNLPILFLTAKNQVQDLQAGFDAGANDYVAKPVHRRELVSRIRLHLQLARWNRSMEIRVAERTQAIRRLLDHAGQGFLTFGGDLLVQSEYSAECERLFAGAIAGRRFDELIDGGSARNERALNEEMLRSIFEAEDELFRDVCFSLLPTEAQLGGYTVQLQYKWIEGDERDEYDPGRVMVVLTDVSEQRRLERRMESERRMLGTVVWVIRHYRDFKDMLEEYRAFAEQGRRDILGGGERLADRWLTLMRIVHTFKGNFAQIDFVAVTERLHELEAQLLEWRDRLAEDPDDFIGDVFAEWFAERPLLDWLEDDLQALRDVLGDRFEQGRDTITIEKDRLDRLEELAMERLPGAEGRLIVEELRKLKYRPLRELLEAHSGYAEKLAARMGKRLYPVALEGGERPVDPDRWTDLARSLVHVYRNMIDHGIETPEERASQGKDPVGRIRCEIVDGGRETAVRLSNDGRALDLASLRETAAARGIAAPETFDAWPPERQRMVLFDPRFSTSGAVTDVSGRGIGLDAVRQAAADLDGRVTVYERDGEVTFELTIPEPSELQRR